MTQQDPASIVISFGKYKGSTVEELLARDPSYAQWLLGQSWLAQRFAELHAAILTRGSTPDDSPEHNAIQARFTEPLFRHAFLLAACPDELRRSQEWDHRRTREWREEPLESARRSAARAADRIAEYSSALRKGWNRYFENELSAAQADQAAALAKIPGLEAVAAQPLPRMVSAVRFEDRGVDVRLAWTFADIPTTSDFGHQVNIEIKPSLGDDYPTVMRQMARTRSTLLLIDTYTGRAVPLPQLRDMFQANGVTLITLREVEAELPTARSAA